MYASMAAVINFLERNAPESTQQAQDRYGCFEQYGTDALFYGYTNGSDILMSCADEVAMQLRDLQQLEQDFGKRNGFLTADAFFYGVQNARLVVHAEEYYRTMFQGQRLAWNIRDRHMAETLDQLVVHFGNQGNPLKVVIWAHNAHLGDARATDMGLKGELSVGQLVRERYRQDAFLIGFTTYTGTITAATNWEKPAQLQFLRPALPGSYEALFHETALPKFMLNMQASTAAIKELKKRRLERRIGVVYSPETEHQSHYYSACLPQQFDVVIHLDETQGLEPLDRRLKELTGEAPATFPSSY
jgi:erythromycin esterase-like protein